MVGPQAGAPLQQQDVLQQQGPQRLAVTERTTMKAADVQPKQPVAHEIEEVSDEIIIRKPT